VYREIYFGLNHKETGLKQNRKIKEQLINCIVHLQGARQNNMHVCCMWALAYLP